MTGIEIVSIANAHDGTHAEVTLSGTPVGALAFLASRTPDALDAAPVSHAALGAGVYSVALPFASGWFLWARDDDGVCHAPGALWVGVSDDADLDVCGVYLRDLLLSYKPLLDAAIAGIYPADSALTLQQVVYGEAALVEAWPALTVHEPRHTEDWVAMPFTKSHQFSFTISALLVHADEQSQLTNLVKFASRVKEILNYPMYADVVLPSGLPLSHCQASEASAREMRGEDGSWWCEATLSWSCYALKQDTLDT